MLNNKSTLIALLSAAVLTACGGGGGDGTAVDARTKYVGTWTSGCDNDGPNFYVKSSITLRTQGAADLVGDYSEKNYNDSNCTDQKTGEWAGDSWTNTYSFVGSTQNLDGGGVADKVRMTLPDDEYAGQTFAAILYTADNKLWTKYNDPDIPDSNENLDGEFPKAIDPDNHMTKVSN